MQKLILPINKCKLTASWKTESYHKRFGYIHYGCDMVSAQYNRVVYASGDGVVAGCGRDNVVGNVVAVLYTDAVNHNGKTADLVIRYFHLDSIAVQKWQKVSKDTVLGRYGNTGMLNMAAHLHIEVDCDYAYPMYSPTVLQSNLIKGRAVGANDKSMDNPLDWLHRKSSAPDWQTWATAGDAYIRAEDRVITAVR